MLRPNPSAEPPHSFVRTTLFYAQLSRADLMRNLTAQLGIAPIVNDQGGRFVMKDQALPSSSSTNDDSLLCEAAVVRMRQHPCWSRLDTDSLRRGCSLSYEIPEAPPNVRLETECYQYITPNLLRRSRRPFCLRSSLSDFQESCS